MRLIALLLRIASLALPAPFRPRWREEALAVLAEVHGGRRWRYALDTALKAPLVARECRYELAVPPRWQLELAGGAMLAALVVTGACVQLSDGRIDQYMFAIAPLGFVPAIAVRAAHGASGLGDYGRAVTVTVLAVTAPLGSVSIDSTASVLVAQAVPCAWLVTVGITTLVRRTGPADQATLGIIIGGLYLVGLLTLLEPVAGVFGLFFLVVMLVEALMCFWSLLAGLRLLTGRDDLFVRNPPS